MTCPHLRVNPCGYYYCQLRYMQKIATDRSIDDRCDTTNCPLKVGL